MMEANEGPRASSEYRPPSANFSEPTAAPVQLQPRPPLLRNDSRTIQGIPPQQPRPVVPQQQRPQFQPGGPVTSPPQFATRPGTPAPRGPLSLGPPGSLQARPLPPPLRSVNTSGPQSFALPQGPRPLQSPTSGQPPQRLPPPNNLQFGPRQPPQFGPYGGATTPDGPRPQINQQPAGVIRNGAPLAPQPTTAQLVRRPSQGLISGPESSNSNPYQNKPANLDNPSILHQYQNKAENGVDMAGMAKARSYSIAAAPGAPSPLKTDDERRKSVSSIGGRVDDPGSRAPGLSLIQEGKLDNVSGSKESVRSDVTNEGREIPRRPESSLGGSKMMDSFISSQSLSTPKKKFDDNDDVVLQNNMPSAKTTTEPNTYQNKSDVDRSPSLTRSSDESPDLKQNLTESNKPPQSQPGLVEPQRPKTPKSETRAEIKPEINVAKQSPNLNRSAKSPMPETKPPPQMNQKPTELRTAPPEVRKSTTPRKTASAPKARPKDGDNDSGVDESTQGNDLNGSPGSPKRASKLPMKEKSSGSIKPSLSRSSSKSATAKTPENPPAEKKKLPMNKIQVGNAPSPNIKAVKSKIGSLDNSTYKPGGGKVKIENKKIELSNVTPRIAAKNETYVPSGGTKKITTAKLEWNAKSKIGSLQNTSYKPGGGDKKIETVKLDFKDKAKPKVASTVNITHKPGGGAVKIENQKLEFKAQSKVGSLDNVKHKPGGGDIKIFDDKDYIKMAGNPAHGSLDHSRQEEYSHMNVQEWTEAEEARVLSSSRSARGPRPSYARRKSVYEDEDRVLRNNERNRRCRPFSAREPPRSNCSRRNSVTQRPAFTVY